MKHSYGIAGMTCSSCETKVKDTLLKIPHVRSVQVSRTDNSAIIEMDKHIALPELQAALQSTGGRYSIKSNETTNEVVKEKNPLSTYKPVLVLFAFIAGITLFTEWVSGSLLWMRWMNHFMAGFFISFSFFKFLDLKGFAESYSTYDIIAKKWAGWGYVYAFSELGLGLAFLSAFQPIVTNAITFVLMSVSMVGVLQSVINKKKIRCACLGAVFNLPMSTVTIVEDGLMIAMSGIMIIAMI